ncbi:hypothetical protein [Planktotalea arctica]|uniref:hypothetical protein n=1 Tax=Planktotalea arctica TaxID=1481893 RepID=UPI00321941DB
MKFDPYEFIAVMIPGALPTLTVSLLVPDVATLLLTNGVELGAFGIFLIVSFVVGHVVQLFGNMIEKAETFVTYGPVDMAVRSSRRPMDADQWQRFVNVIETLGLTTQQGPTHETWPGIRREVYARLSADGRTERIDMFNRTYGLCRGMVAGALLSSGIMLLLGEADSWKTAILVVGLLALPLYVRMRRFSRYYFNEIVSQFLATQNEQTK